jgi:DNA-binding NarL/FixJ family response regulator
VIRVIVADDHPVVREGLRRILERQVGIEVVAEVARGDTLPALVQERNADVVVLDIGMPGPDFLQLIPDILAVRSAARVLVLSGHPEEVYAVHALRAGAAGYLNKADASDSLVEAVRRIQVGGRYISAALADRLAQQVADNEGTPGHFRLSGRELEVLRFMGAGVSQKEIAARLHVNAKTISTYRSRILSKLGLRTTADLVRYALEHHLVAGPAAPGHHEG